MSFSFKLLVLVFIIYFAFSQYLIEETGIMVDKLGNVVDVMMKHCTECSVCDNEKIKY